MHQSTSHGHYEVVRLMLDKGADVNAKWYEETALCRAASDGMKRSCGFCWRRGQTLSRSIGIEMMLHRAAECGHSAVVQLLLDNGTDVVAMNMVLQTALHLAASRGHEAPRSEGRHQRSASR
jgi:ankyrin repeat protein